jgi:hypothetical protein
MFTKRGLPTVSGKAFFFPKLIGKPERPLFAARYYIDSSNQTKMISVWWRIVQSGATQETVSG